jgi:HK97 family phage prohead protease
MDYKSFRLTEVKAVDDEPGQFEGYAAVYGNADRNGDVIDVGAMTRTINSSDGEFPLLWQHDQHSPIGVVRLEDTPKGAKAIGKIALSSPTGAMAYSLLLPPNGFKRGALRGLSIGYQTKKDEIKGSERHLKEIQIHEVSLVTIAANPKAQIMKVKSAELDRISKLELAVKALGTALAKEGLISDSESIYSLLGSDGDDAGNDGDPNPIHSPVYKNLIDEMRAYNFLKGIKT